MSELFYEVDIHDSRHPFRTLVIQLAVGSIIASVLGGISFLVMGSANGWPFTAGLLFGMGVTTYRLAPLWPITKMSYLHATKADIKQQFCADCGKPFEKRQRQDGFDPVTGKPNMIGSWGCPDGDPNRPSKMSALYSGSISAFGWTPKPHDMYDWPNCHNKVATGFSAVATHNHAAGLTDVKCHACIDQMVKDRVITVKSAETLRQQAS